MRYSTVQLPYRARSLADGSSLVVSNSGDHAVLSSSEFNAFLGQPLTLSLERQAELRAKFLLGDEKPAIGMRRLLASRVAARRETLAAGPSLHIIVPTLQCAHTCQYCQVSRALTDSGFSMSFSTLDLACDSIFDSPAKNLTVEFQGGDPLNRFDLVRHAIERIAETNKSQGRHIRFVIASTLHQLDEEMCAFFIEHGVHLSTSIDGPAALHNRNRPLPTRDSFEKTVAGIELARKRMGHDAVAALMTTTRASLTLPEAIVDTYVELGFREIFLRPLSLYGFAKRNQVLLGYTLPEFLAFYERGLQRVLEWNEQGTEIREVYASILLNKILSPFDAGYVDLQSPTGAGTSVLVYNYDGYVYPSDEARMLAETGDKSLRMGPIGSPLSALLASPVRRGLLDHSSSSTGSCASCAYGLYCSPNPVDALAQHGKFDVEVTQTEHCQRHMALFDHMFGILNRVEGEMLDHLHLWAQPTAVKASAL